VLWILHPTTITTNVLNNPFFCNIMSKNIVTCLRFSIWLDSKLRLQTDPILILEYFLWRHGYEYAISNHYDRHCVWEEVAQNKKLNKFNHTIIDQQFEFYQADGLTRFNPLDPNKLLPSCTLSHLLILVLVYEFCLPEKCVPCYRCPWRFFHREGTHTNVQFILLPMVQWSWSLHTPWSAQLCIYILEA
jgi:hypothetical protein